MKNCGCQDNIPCGCQPNLECGCGPKHDLLCTVYTGPDLQPLGIVKGTNGETVITKINDYLTELEETQQEDPSVLIESVGGKIDIYKGLSDAFIHEIKSIRGEKGVIVEDAIPSSDCDEPDFINVKIDTAWLTSFLNTWITTVDLCDSIGECLPSTGNRPSNESITLNTDYLEPIVFTPGMIIPHMSDPDGDIVQARINSNSPDDLTGYKLNGFDYVGEWINIVDLGNLIFYPANVPGGYTKSNKWQVKDSMGNISP